MNANIVSLPLRQLINRLHLFYYQKPTIDYRVCGVGLPMVKIVLLETVKEKKQ